MSLPDDRKLALLIRLLVVGAVLVSALGFRVDLKNTLNTGGIDFRNRVVGARLLREGLDPYHFKWTPNFSETLLDPLDKPASPITRTSVPPSVLVLLAPMTHLHYMTLRVLWLIFQWIALLASLGILAKSARSKEKAIVVWIIGLVFVAGSYAWRSHIAVGQIYILFVLLYALAYWLLLKHHPLSGMVGGFLLGLTASLRLPVLVMGIPLLVYRQWKILIGGTLGLFFGVTGSIIVGGAEVWKSYFSAMRVHGLIQYSWEQLPKGAYAERIEGMTNLSKNLPFHAGDASILGIFYHHLGINIATVLLPILGAVVLVAAWILYKHYRKSLPVSLVFQVGLVFVLVSDFFLPAARYAYQDVIWLMLLPLVVINADSLKALLDPLMVLAVSGLCLSVGFTWVPWRTVVMEAAMLLYFVFTTLGFVHKGSEHTS